MNTQKVLIGALLAQPDLAPYSLPELDVEHFAACIRRRVWVLELNRHVGCCTNLRTVSRPESGNHELL